MKRAGRKKHIDTFIDIICGNIDKRGGRGGRKRERERERGRKTNCCAIFLVQDNYTGVEEKIARIASANL